ncbi:tRNA (cytosine(34)-C(5))-methyltransferase [Cajanus cajan]|uniref:tRNA (Cytosine-5-)-methyltransferase NSUN2 n=1 Tax=Cajanus cajan TaxID=3821 RepID=A0A151S3D4_CAJCA|nr:tRNA (cytosine(34)-C(5))-methyltransferase [Cajanus cajan]KYP49278.1 tRNA (cytosine-5-)-methyltransferase NSUN2 [Cajanus cajan]
MGGGGRGGRSRTQRKHFRQSRENVWKRSKPDHDPSSTENPSWTPFATQNDAFDFYYKEQGIVHPQQWEQFVAVLRTPLPATFRINSSSQFSDDIRSQLEDDFMHSLRNEVVEGGETEAIRPLLWYPGNFAWHSNFSRMQLRKNQTLERFHEFLKLENEIGNITRQEAVSMVPPLFLDVHSNHFVLDMCAAPGSKTFQLLEIIHESTKAGSLPDGMVIANDVDVQRCNLLIHQTKRMCTANLIVTNHEAQHFPGCRLNRNYERTELDHSIGQLLFDRVLCDVPCSGDGTLRKAPDMWRKWNTGMGQGLHSLQVLIAMRGLSLLKNGGRMVYSTCSMNPIENEAVVAEVLRRCGGSVELLDVSSELPQLIRRPGLKKWKVYDKGTWLVSYKDVPKFRRSVILPSMFPSGRGHQDLVDSSCNVDVDDITNVNGNAGDGILAVENPAMSESSVEVSDFPLEHCMRIVPHDQNTGAFFIAVLQKVSPLPAISDKTKIEIDEKCVEPTNHSLNDAQVPEINSPESTHEEVLKSVSEENVDDNEPNTEDLEVSPVTCDEQNSKETQEPNNVPNMAKRVPGKRKLQIQGKWRGVDPVVFFKDEAIINSIRDFYGINEHFPFNGHLVTRNSDVNHVKRIYYISKSVKDVLELNFKVGQQLKITSIGLKMFERQTAREGNSAPCAFRISSEGLPLILPYITKQILHASPADFKHLLQNKDVKFEDFIDAEFGEKAANLMPGCCVVIMSKGNSVATESLQVDESTIAIGCWKGRARLSVMVTAMDCQELLERLLIRFDTKNGSSGHVAAEVQPVQELNSKNDHDDGDVKASVN